MSLQFALITLGLVVLGAVAALSFFKRRSTPVSWLAQLRAGIASQAENFRWPVALNFMHPDRLVNRVRQREPSLIASHDFEGQASARTKGGGLKAADQATPVDSSDQHPVEPTRVLDSEIGSAPIKIDYWVRLPGQTPVTRDLALSVFREHEINLSHPRAIHGRTEPGNAWLDLRDASAGEIFTDLIISVQMADPDRCVDESELTRFNNLAYALAETLDRPLQFESSIEEALPEAARLERFCHEFDLLAVINIEPEPGAGFSGPDVARVAGRAGMRLGEQDIFHFFDSRTGVSRFGLANQREPGSFSYADLESGMFRGLALFMNIPRVEHPARTFAELRSVAQYVSTELNGSLVDPDGAILSSAQFDSIRRQIQSIERSMKKYGVEPGSDEARRLF